jgi:hypothetical protein
MAIILTLAQQCLADGFNDQKVNYGHVLSSGTNNFPCLMTPASPADLAFDEMFKDLREVSIATVLGSELPSWVVAQMQLTDESGQGWTTLKRINNPSDIASEVWVQKVTANDH